MDISKLLKDSSKEILNTSSIKNDKSLMNQINMSRIEDAEKKRILLEKEKEYNFLENLIKKNEKIKSKNFKA